MCGGGFAIPLWALPIFGAVCVAGAAGQGAVAVGRGVAAGATAAGQSVKRAAQAGAEAVDQLLHPDVLAAAIAADPTNPSLFLQRARLTLAAIDEYQQGGRRRPAASGRRPPAVRHALAAVALREPPAVCHAESDEAADKRRVRYNLKSAIEDAARSVELSGGPESVASVGGLLVMGVALDRLGRWADAASAFGDAIKVLEAHHDGHDNACKQEEEQGKEEHGEGEEEEEEERCLVGGTKKRKDGTKGKAEHMYEIKTFYKPTFCDHCSKLLVGLRNQGYQCVECNSTMHANCREHYTVPCRSQPESHCFKQQDFHVPTLCSHCKLMLIGFKKQGLYCSACQSSVHERCAAAFTSKKPSCAAPRPLLSVRPQLQREQQAVAQVNRVGLADLYNYRGLALYHASLYEEAIKCFTTAAMENSSEYQQFVAIANRGLCFFYLERLDEAIADLSLAIKHGATNEQIYSTRATAYQLQGKDELAGADRKMARLLDPHAIVDVFPYPLPLELVAEIFTFLTPRDQARCALTCRLWRDLIYAKAQQIPRAPPPPQWTSGLSCSW